MKIIRTIALMRLDHYITEHTNIRSRSRAQEIITRGLVIVNGIVTTKPSKEVSVNDTIVVQNDLPYVSRAGEKLAFALRAFEVNPAGMNCLDIGSSTGGFTDCLLQHGAAHIVAVDVGTDQFDTTLKNNEKVELFEQTDIRDFSSTDLFDLVVCDVSFISITKIIPEVQRFLKPGGHAIILIKPQFEVMPDERTKQGIVKSSVNIQSIITTITAIANDYQLVLADEVIPVPLRGGDGNQEYIAHFAHSA